MAFSACCAFHLFFYVFLRENNPFSKNVQFLHIYFVLFTILRISYSNRVVNNAYYLMQLHEANRVNQLCVCMLDFCLLQYQDRKPNSKKQKKFAIVVKEDFKEVL